MSSLKEDLAYLIQILTEKEYIVLSPDIRITLLESLSGCENLFYELEKWKSNYQILEKELHARGQKCLKFHIPDRLRKEQYIHHVSEYKCGICSQKLQFDKYIERYDSNKFLCDICLRTHHISSGIYYCKHCKFDVCNNCPDFLNINRKCPKCNEKIHHFHALTDPINGNYTCYKCENQALDINGVYSCENCGFLMCPTCEKKDRNVILFDKLQSNSRKNTPLKKNHLDELSSSNKSPNLFEKVKKSGFISDNTVNPLNQDIKNEDLITFSNKHTDNFYPNQYLKETYPELKKIDIKPLISEKLDKTPILTPLIEIKSPIYKEKSEKSEYNYNKIAPPMLLEPAEKIYTPIKQEIFNKPLDNLKFTAKETSFITKTQGVYDNNYPDPNPFEKDYQYSHPFQKI